MADRIDMDDVLNDDRRAALTGPAMALLIEADHYGVQIRVEDGRPILSGKLPPEAGETQFLQRLGECRRAVTIAADSLALGWKLEWSADGASCRVLAPARPSDYRNEISSGQRGGTGRRPASWVDTEGKPVPAGTTCRSCRGHLWWREAVRPQGWRCRACHPPTGAVPVMEVSTAEADLSAAA
ncbi:hypothetical protein K6L44_07165 [Gluconacetobacter entanii]|uniref:hypothetical protein n=1 Tax=Gluconacetobacter entanii TaxID=108528 RepID=UPI001C931E54|nr:hypothetical protein [Gluconacetobacter entanii]MBY4639775.1 hypothetical protein [Gluconacetobacter entanii]MCW4579491.1 hypothetical protein [Gluconacetobacter entanii]MCW4582856.1 hypothetical protein [Gluconacetobacter entanii]MCW4586292.1 hypothetical protein [Gluconacetobacter entanii]